MTLTGTNFTGATSVLFLGVNAFFTFASDNNFLDTKITTIVPTNAISGPITIVTPHGIATSSTVFSITVPEVPMFLTGRALTNHLVELSWPDGPVEFSLESTDVLGAGALWQTVTRTAVLENNHHKLTMSANSGTRYFRLHKTVPVVPAVP